MLLLILIANWLVQTLTMLCDFVLVNSIMAVQTTHN